MTAPVTDSASWDELWKAHFGTYVSAIPRTGVFIQKLFPGAESFLEIGAGSARDTRYLDQVGKEATASDFSPHAIEIWKEAFSQNFKGLCLDCFNLALPDKAFDVSFHNGLYVLFDDAQIKRALIEQQRVTKQAMAIVVHNKLNTKMAKSFDAGRESNPLARIRLFEPIEMRELIVSSGIPYKWISIHKFGGSFDRAYRLPISKKDPLKRTQRLGTLACALYPFTPWSRVERVAAVVHL